MITPTQGTLPAAQMQGDAQAASARPVLTMVQSDRMAGPVPVWGPPRGPQDSVAGALSRAMSDDENRVDGAMAYAAQNASGGADEEFGFGDLLDMINPLQHIPIVSRIYRGITGDHIKPVSQVIGDTLYGGPAGGALSLTNVIIAHETGRDIPGNVMAIARGEEIHYRSEGADKPEQRLELAAAGDAPGGMKDLPGSTLAFADMKAGGASAAYAADESADDRAAARRIIVARPAAAAPSAAPAASASASAGTAIIAAAPHGAFRSLHLND